MSAQHNDILLLCVLICSLAGYVHAVDINQNSTEAQVVPGPSDTVGASARPEEEPAPISLVDRFLYLISLPPVWGAAVVIGARVYSDFNAWWKWLRSLCVVQMTVESSDDSFDNISEWLHANPSLTLFTSRAARVEVDRKRAKEDASGGPPPLRFDDGDGVSLLWYAGRIMWVYRWSSKPSTEGWEQRPVVRRHLRITTLGMQRQVLERLVAEAQLHAFEGEQSKTRVFVAHPARWRTWRKIEAREPRPLESVILDRIRGPDGLMVDIGDYLLQDLTRFFSSRKWYQDRGVPWRRGYMLHGPPGTGKTSTVMSIAGALDPKLDVCVVNLAGNSVDDRRLQRLFQDSPPRSILLLEDIDGIFVQRQASRSSGGVGVSFSGLLNALDGVASQQGRVVFMTTNHLEKLDPALVRPGRCDIHIRLDYASPNQVRKMFLHFYAARQEIDHGLSEDGAVRGLRKKGREETVQAPNEGQLHSMASSGGPATLAGAITPTWPTASIARSPSKPQLEAMADLFAQRCSRKQLAPAALQGHMLKYRDRPGAACSEIAVAELLGRQGKVSTVGNLMSVHEWLYRAGMEQYLDGFTGEGVITVDDIKGRDAAALERYGISILGHRRQLAALLSGDEAAMTEFAWCSGAQAERRVLECFATEGSVSDTMPGTDDLLPSRADGTSPLTPNRTSPGLSPLHMVRRSSSASISTEVVVSSDLQGVAKQIAAAVRPRSMTLAQLSKLCSLYVVPASELHPGKDLGGAQTLVPAGITQLVQDVMGAIRQGASLMRGRYGGQLDLLAMREDELATAGIEAQVAIAVAPGTSQAGMDAMIRSQKAWIRGLLQDQAPAEHFLRSCGGARVVSSVGEFSGAYLMRELREMLESGGKGNASASAAGLCDQVLLERCKACLGKKPNAIRGLCRVGASSSDRAGAAITARRLFREVFSDQSRQSDGASDAEETFITVLSSSPALLTEWQVLDTLRFTAACDAAGYPSLEANPRHAAVHVGRAVQRALAVKGRAFNPQHGLHGNGGRSSSAPEAICIEIARLQQMSRLALQNGNWKLRAPQASFDKAAHDLRTSDLPVALGITKADALAPLDDIMPCGCIAVAFRRAGLSRAIRKVHAQRIFTVRQMLVATGASRRPKKNDVGDFNLQTNELVELGEVLSLTNGAAYASRLALEPCVLEDAVTVAFYAAPRSRLHALVEALMPCLGRVAIGMVREWAESVATGCIEPSPIALGRQQVRSLLMGGNARASGGGSKSRSKKAPVSSESSEFKTVGFQLEDVDGTRALQCVDWLLNCDANLRGPGEPRLLSATPHSTDQSQSQSVATGDLDAAKAVIGRTSLQDAASGCDKECSTAEIASDLDATDRGATDRGATDRGATGKEVVTMSPSEKIQQSLRHVLAIPVLQVVLAVWEGQPDHTAGDIDGDGDGADADADAGEGSCEISTTVEATVKALVGAGVRSAAILAALTAEELSTVQGLSLGLKKRLHFSAKQMVEQQ